LIELRLIANAESTLTAKITSKAFSTANTADEVITNTNCRIGTAY
jgi:hypothetical protein